MLWHTGHDQHVIIIQRNSLVSNRSEPSDVRRGSAHSSRQELPIHSAPWVETIVTKSSCHSLAGAKLYVFPHVFKHRMLVWQGQAGERVKHLHIQHDPNHQTKQHCCTHTTMPRKKRARWVNHRLFQDWISLTYFSCPCRPVQSHRSTDPEREHSAWASELCS